MKHRLARQMTGLLRQLRLGPWLDRLDHGPDTVLAPRGQPVLGGELQRPSVARTADRSLLWITHRPEELAAFADVRYLSIDPA
jgi:hypothetical protein